MPGWSWAWSRPTRFLCTLPNSLGQVQNLQRLPVFTPPRLFKVALVGAAHSGRAELRKALLESQATQANPAALEVTVAQDAGFPNQHFDVVLLMGLDLPSAREGGLQDQTWRARLQQANLPFQVIYGWGPARLRNAWAALARLLPVAQAPTPDGTSLAPFALENGATQSRWQLHCEKCSDGDCEHRLFTALQRKKQSAAEKSGA